MRTVIKLKKRSLYVLGIIFTLVFTYVFRANSSEEGGKKILTAVPEALADVPMPLDGGNDGGVDGSADSGGDGGGSDGCFVAGTRVTMADGSYLPIEQIKPGAVVLGAEGATYVVAGLIAHDGKDAFTHNYDKEVLKEISFANGLSVKTVDGHPVFVHDTQGWHWSNMSALKVGVQAMTEQGVSTVVSVVELKNERPTLFNLELIVEEGAPRSYFANGILVRDTQFIEYSINRFVAPPMATVYHS